MTSTIEIYTDGACRGNPGPGGWAALLICGEHEKELSGAEALTTNNRMELTAVIRALEALKRPVAGAHLHRLAVRAPRHHRVAAQLEGARLAHRRRSRSRIRTCGSGSTSWPPRHEIEWHWVKGHSGRAGQRARRSAGE